MKAQRVGRRKFLGMAGTAAVMSAVPRASARSARTQKAAPKIKFGVIGINHSHIFGQVERRAARRRRAGLVLRQGSGSRSPRSEAVSAGEARVGSENEILEDRGIQLVLSSAIPDERAPLGIRVMKHGKDYMVDKPGITTLEQLAEVRRVQAETRRIYSIMYSERFENRATVKAGELVKAGAIGRVVQTIGLGPHRMNPKTRPAWFFDRPRFGGILCDIASHQADQFLYFTGSTRADIVAAQVGNVHHPQYPTFEDFGDVMVRGDGGAGYIRVDWFTPDGLATWGDGRLTVLGTDGFIEIRKNIDIAGGRAKATCSSSIRKRRVTSTAAMCRCRTVSSSSSDVVNRTETAMTQAHCFLATELVLKAQAAGAARQLQAP